MFFVSSLETCGAARVGLGKEELRRKQARGEGPIRNLSHLGGGQIWGNKDAPETQLCRPTKQYFDFSVDPVLHFGYSWLSLLLRVYFVTETVLSSFLAPYTCTSTCCRR